MGTVTFHDAPGLGVREEKQGGGSVSEWLCQPLKGVDASLRLASRVLLLFLPG